MSGKKRPLLDARCTVVRAGYHTATHRPRQGNMAAQASSGLAGAVW